jgi:5-hydroxyisourate hydrolase
MGITTHVLDTSKGRPASGVQVELDRLADGAWSRIGEGRTDADGRLKTLTPAGQPVAAGRYRLTFDTGPYFAAQNLAAFYPDVTVTFEVSDDGHYHVPLLLSPFGYSTYRGS